MKMYLYKDDEDDRWNFSLVPFEELQPEDNVISCSINNDEWLDVIFEELNIKDTNYKD